MKYRYGIEVCKCLCSLVLSDFVAVTVANEIGGKRKMMQCNLRSKPNVLGLN